jgi:hypothetical protein
VEIDVRISDMNWMQVEEYLRHDETIGNIRAVSRLTESPFSDPPAVPPAATADRRRVHEEVDGSGAFKGHGQSRDHGM